MWQRKRSHDLWRGRHLAALNAIGTRLQMPIGSKLKCVAIVLLIDSGDCE